MIRAIFEYQFLQNAIIACILASVVCGLIGVIIVEKKLVMMSGGIAHTAYGGVGLGYFLGFEPVLGALIFSVAASLGVGLLKKKGGGNSDVIIGLFWSLGMALGILFIAITPGYPPDLNSYLFGNILSVTKANLYFMLIITIIVLLVVISLFNDWKAYLFDEEFAFVMGIKTRFLEYLLMVLIAMSVVVLLRVAGIILALALFTAPAATAGLLTKNLKRRMLYAIILGIIYCLLGLWVSYTFNIASGSTIVILSVIGYILGYLFRFILAKITSDKIKSQL